MRITNVIGQLPAWPDARRPAAPLVRRLLARLAALLIGGGALSPVPMLSAAHAADALPPLHETGLAAAAPKTPASIRASSSTCRAGSASRSSTCTACSS
ncbi:hypothetical protein ACVK00_001139 [Burkholderia sp. PvR073]|uniref:hypothetical protein n=1 Tax=Burkholderia ambifaria TaxID=152480 RepID=UPI003396D812